MKIIILGSTGMMGTYLKKFLKADYEIVCPSRAQLNFMSDRQTVLKYFYETLDVGTTDIIINAAGIIKQRVTASVMEMIMVNAVMPNLLAEVKQARSCNVIHLTTDCVYSGIKGGYVETDPHDCVDAYGKTKSLGENQNLTVIRTSIIGEELQNKFSLVEWVKSKRDKRVQGYIDHTWNGLTCLELSRFIRAMIGFQAFWKGTHHVHSDTVSKFGLIKMINDIYHLNITIDPTPTEPCKRDLKSLFNNFIAVKPLIEQIIDMEDFKLE